MEKILKYACELKKNDFIRLNKRKSGIVKSVKSDIFSNVCYIEIDSGEVIKTYQDEKFEIIE